MKFLSQGNFTSHILHTIYRSDKMYQKIDKMVKDLEIRGRSEANIKTTSIYLHVKDYQTLNITSPLDRV